MDNANPGGALVTVILHAGLPKTGTKSLQGAMAARRADLARAGFFYPRLDDGPFAGHWALGSFWRETMQEPTEGHLMLRLDARGTPGAVRQEITDKLTEAVAEARAFGKGVVILSDEHLGYDPALEGCRRLSRLFQGLGARLEVLAYARPDLDFFPSRVQQQMKSLRFPFALANMRHAPMIDLLQRGFGAVRVRVHGRDTLEGGEVLADFSAWVERLTGRRPDLGQMPARLNVSIPAAGCALLLHVSQRSDPKADAPGFEMLRWSVMNSRSDLGAGGLVLPPGWAERLLEQGHADWNRILDLTEHPPELRARLALTPRGAAPGGAITVEEIRAWVEGGRDLDYEARLRAWVAARPEAWVPQVLGLLDRTAAGPVD